VSDSHDPRAAGWRFFLWWMLTFLGFPLGGLLALVLVGSVEGVLSGALGGALAGAVIGLTQWSVLRRYVRVGPEWVLATALGVAIGDGVGALLTDAGTGIGGPAHHRTGYWRRGGTAAVGPLLAGSTPARKPVAAGRRDRLAGWLDGDMGCWSGRRARLRRVWLDGCAGLRGYHRPCDATHAPQTDPLAPGVDLILGSSGK
jgi:hypothetical protein